MSTSPSAIGNPQSAIPLHPLARQPSDRLIHAGERVELVLRPVITNSGKTISREVAIHPGAVIILPILPDGRILLIHNRRHTVHESLLELPAGTLERPPATPMGVSHEDPAAAAARELTEETGYAAKNITPFGWFYTSPGILTEKMYAFLATGLTPGPQHLEDNEQIATQPFTPDHIRSLIHENKIVDAKSLAALLKYLAGL
ncbi:MAG TPA: NUDIX hydrolase [Phycisphaerae bacterium]|nr:NUDIX hydrolase [Phycisphaerae bacterium]